MDDMEVTDQVAKIIAAANAALLDGHAKMSVAYLATRVTQLEDENRRLSKEVTALNSTLSKARDSYAQLKRRIEAAEEMFQRRLAENEVTI